MSLGAMNSSGQSSDYNGFAATLFDSALSDEELQRLKAKLKLVDDRHDDAKTICTVDVIRGATDVLPAQRVSRDGLDWEEQAFRIVCKSACRECRFDRVCTADDMNDGLTISKLYPLWNAVKSLSICHLIIDVKNLKISNLPMKAVMDRLVSKRGEY